MFYYCKKAMQVLTGQYPTMYTHKFRVFYNDFKAVSSNYGKIKLFTLAKGYQVISTMLSGNTLFAGGSLTNAPIRLHDSTSLPYGDNATGQFNVTSGAVPIGDNRGSFLPVPQRLVAISGTSRLIICNKTAPTDIYATIYVQNTGGLAALTQGAMDIWVTVARFS